eukprot:859798-Pleurochrysis_carterae.AAC.2
MLSCECLDFVHSWRKFGVNKRSFTVLDPTSTKRIVEEGGGVKSSFRSGLRYAYEKKENKHKQHVSTGNSSCSGEDGERESRFIHVCTVRGRREHEESVKCFARNQPVTKASSHACPVQAGTSIATHADSNWKQQPAAKSSNLHAHKIITRLLAQSTEAG